MIDLYERVREFMFGRKQYVGGVPKAPPDDVVRQRCRWQLEEALELLEACFSTDDGAKLDMDYIRSAVSAFIATSPVHVDLVAYADANADIRYVAYGNDVAAGIDGRDTDGEVARSNDSKGDTSPDGKVSKGPTYSAPNIAGVLKDQGWKEQS